MFDVIAYFDVIFGLSRSGEESFNKFLSPDPNSDTDHAKEGSSHRYTAYCVQESSQSVQ